MIGKEYLKEVFEEALLNCYCKAVLDAVGREDTSTASLAQLFGMKATHAEKVFRFLQNKKAIVISQGSVSKGDSFNEIYSLFQGGRKDLFRNLQSV